MSGQPSARDYASVIEWLDAVEAWLNGLEADGEDVADALAEVKTAQCREEALIQLSAEGTDAELEEARIESEAIARSRVEAFRAEYRARKAEVETVAEPPDATTRIVVADGDRFYFLASVDIDEDADYVPSTWTVPPVPVLRFHETPSVLRRRDVKRAGLRAPTVNEISRVLGVTRLAALAVTESLTRFQIDKDGNLVADEDGNPTPVGMIVEWYVYDVAKWESVDGSSSERKARWGRKERDTGANAKTPNAGEDGRSQAAVEAAAGGATTTRDLAAAMKVSEPTARGLLRGWGWSESGGGAGRRPSWSPPAVDDE